MFTQIMAWTFFFAMPLTWIVVFVINRIHFFCNKSKKEMDGKKSSRLLDTIITTLVWTCVMGIQLDLFFLAMKPHYSRKQCC